MIWQSSLIPEKYINWHSQESFSVWYLLGEKVLKRHQQGTSRRTQEEGWELEWYSLQQSKSPKPAGTATSLRQHASIFNST